MRGGGRDGRGNLRENREDPAPTVGIAIRIAPKGRPLPPPCAYHATPHAALLWRPYGFYNDAACRVVIPLYAFPVDAGVGVHAGRRQAPQCLL